MTLKTSPKKEHGFALISVLGIVILLSMISVTLISATRNTALITQRGQNSVDRRALNDAALNFASLQLIKRGEFAEWGPHSPSLEMTWNEIPISIKIQDERGKFDLNAGDVAGFKAMLIELDAPSAEVVRISQSFTVFRDQQFSEQHSSYRATFPSIMAIRNIVGLQGDDVARLLPHITVHSKLRQRDIRVSTTVNYKGESNSTMAYLPISGGRAFTVTIQYIVEGRRYSTQHLLSIRSTKSISNGSVYWRLGN